MIAWLVACLGVSDAVSLADVIPLGLDRDVGGCRRHRQGRSHHPSSHARPSSLPVPIDRADVHGVVCPCGKPVYRVAQLLGREISVSVAHWSFADLIGREGRGTGDSRYKQDISACVQEREYTQRSFFWGRSGRLFGTSAEVLPHWEMRSAVPSWPHLGTRRFLSCRILFEKLESHVGSVPSTQPRVDTMQCARLYILPQTRS